MHWREIQNESGAATARDFALPRLRELLRLAQEALQREGPGEHRQADVEALNAAIREVAASSGQRPAQNANQPRQDRDARRGGQRNAPKSRGRRPMGRKPGR